MNTQSTESKKKNDKKTKKKVHRKQLSKVSYVCCLLPSLKNSGETRQGHFLASLYVTPTLWRIQVAWRKWRCKKKEQNTNTDQTKWRMLNSLPLTSFAWKWFGGSVLFLKTLRELQWHKSRVVCFGWGRGICGKKKCGRGLTGQSSINYNKQELTRNKCCKPFEVPLGKKKKQTVEKFLPIAMPLLTNRSQNRNSAQATQFGALEIWHNLRFPQSNALTERQFMPFMMNALSSKA